VVYGHGTGADYRNGVDHFGAEYATGDAPGGAPVPMAVLGFDGVLHGTRRGMSTKPPSELVYNFLNPRAARDNALQAGADLFAIVRAVESLGTAAGTKLDKAKVALYGHSQGGNAAAIAGGREPGYGVVVLSGTGGTLLYSFLKKTNPVNVAGALPFVLGDPVVDENHPALNLLQMYFDRSDPVNYGRRFLTEPPMGVMPHHLLHVFGIKDTYSPVETQLTFAQAARLPLAGAVQDPAHNLAVETMAAPIMANHQAATGKVTAVHMQYAPGAYDGHFVSTQNDNARKAIRQMLVTFMRGGTPAVQP
jgi:pimeloyl-ACP methyl ester carboxylesterase